MLREILLLCTHIIFTFVGIEWDYHVSFLHTRTPTVSQVSWKSLEPFEITRHVTHECVLHICGHRICFPVENMRLLNGNTSTWLLYLHHLFHLLGALSVASPTHHHTGFWHNKKSKKHVYYLFLYFLTKMLFVQLTLVLTKFITYEW